MAMMRTDDAMRLPRRYVVDWPRLVLTRLAVGSLAFAAVLSGAITSGLSAPAVGVTIGAILLPAVLAAWLLSKRPGAAATMLKSNLSELGHPSARIIRSSTQLTESLRQLGLDVSSLKPTEYLAITVTRTALTIWQLRQGRAEPLANVEWAAVASQRFGVTSTGVSFERAIYLKLREPASQIEIPLSIQEGARGGYRPLADAKLRTAARDIELVRGVS